MAKKKFDKAITMQLYLETAEKYMEDNMTEDEKMSLDVNADRDHAISIAASIMMTRDKFLQGGDFVKYFVANDLERAIAYADRTCIKCFKVFMHVKRNCFVPRHQFEIE